jgi:hypothetical protein
VSALLWIGIPTAYAVIGFFAGTEVYRRERAFYAREELKGRGDQLSDLPLPRMDGVESFDAVSHAWVAGLFWPLVVVLAGPVLLVGGLIYLRTGNYVTPAERELAERRELLALRGQAKELGLPMPEVKP